VNIDKYDLPRMLFFDTETTGLRPGNICQLSYIITNGENIEPHNYFFKVDYIEPGAERIHGLSVRKLATLSNNKTFKDNFNGIREDFETAELLIGHNISFDLNFMKSEFSSCGHNYSYNESLCTMRYFTDICKIPKANGYGYKSPRLEELTRYLGIKDKEIINVTEEIFKCNSGYHDARFDTVATYLCYMKAFDKGLIKTKKAAY